MNYSNFFRAFTSLCYSADGESMLAGGHSKFVCIYNIKEQILMKKFEISCNLSLDAMEVQSRPLIKNLKFSMLSCVRLSAILVILKAIFHVTVLC